MSGAAGAWRPERAIEIVAGTPPGGGLDRAARALAAAIEAGAKLDAGVLVRNIPGDGARKCWAYLAGRAGDPHVVSISSANLTTDHLLGASPFRHEHAFTPLAILYTEYIAFVSRPDCPIGSAADLLECLAARPDGLVVALSTSLGNPNHIALAQVARRAGADPRAPTIRVFDSARDAVADVAAGNALVGAVTAASAVPELAAGTLRSLAVSAPQRLEGPYRATPTWTELGVDCVVGAWRGVTGARGLAPREVAFWEDLLRAAVATPPWREALERHHWTALYLDGAGLREHLAREREETSTVLRALGLLER